MKTTRSINLKNRPKGKSELAGFEFSTTEIPELQEGEILLSTKYVSVDSYLRVRMSDAPSYVEPFKLIKPIASGIIAEVIDSKNT